MMAPFQILKNKKLAEYRDHPVLFTDVNHDKARQLFTSKQIPVGGFWSAILQTVFGPKNNA